MKHKMNAVSSDSSQQNNNNSTKTFSLQELQTHNTPQDAWIAIDGSVYDVTKFLTLHPGGDSIILDYVGTDCSNEFNHDVHEHSSSAKSLLKDYYVGKLSGSKLIQDPKTVRLAQIQALVDFNKPVLPQILKMGSEYQEWVHVTSSSKMRIFQWDFFEAFSYYPWWYIFIMWIPVICYLFYQSLAAGNSLAVSSGLFVLGMFVWTFLEYLIHRYLFHMSSSSPTGNFFHFFLHGAHHLTPMEPSRLTFPPTFAPPVGFLIYYLVSLVTPREITLPLFAGGAFMYMMYDTLHFMFHHGGVLSEIGYVAAMKKRHMSHHFKDDSKNFGVTSPFWDVVFGTNGPEWTIFDKDPLAVGKQ